MISLAYYHFLKLHVKSDAIWEIDTLQLPARHSEYMQ